MLLKTDGGDKMTAQGQLFVEDYLYEEIKEVLKKHFGDGVWLDGSEYSDIWDEGELPDFLEAPILNEKNKEVGRVKAKLHFVFEEWGFSDIPHPIPRLKEVVIYKGEKEVERITFYDPHKNTRKAIKEAIEMIEKALAILDEVAEWETMN